MTECSTNRQLHYFARFPRAAHYCNMRVKTTGILRDPPASRLSPSSERQLHCVWYDDSLRPKNLLSSQGEAIRVINPGRWNFEAGPDFLDAEIEILPGRQHIIGDVEIHIDSDDWFHHGHDQDPRYTHVRFHVVAHKGGRAPDHLIQIELESFLAGNPAFSFDAIDVSAYPYQTNAANAPCRKQLEQWHISELEELLESAGEERIRRKTIRLAEEINVLGSKQALYRATLGALGYKQNKGACMYLADHLPLSLLKERSADNPEAGLALLLGMSGFLPGNPEIFSSETKNYAKQLWNFWWRHRADLEDLSLREDNWILANIRPANAPQRRLMAAALLFLSTDYADWVLSTKPEEEKLSQIRNRLRVHHPFWDVHSALTNDKPMQRKTALLGRARIDALLVNILLPFWLAHKSEIKMKKLTHLIPKTPPNALTKYTAHALFGPDVPSSLTSCGLRQQGLLQIFHDFCMTGSCCECEFVQALSAHSNTV